MRAEDFIYNGVQLSSYGLVMGQLDSSSGLTTDGVGSEITFNTVQMNNGSRNSLTSTKYNSRIEISFDIYKDPCVHNTMEITEEEARIITRWLNRHSFLPFRFVFLPETDSLYLRTGDASIMSGKEYYVRSGAGTIMSPYIYKLVSSPSVSKLQEYFEYNPFVCSYRKVSDNQINALKCYYTKEGNGSVSTPYQYKYVTSPSLSSISNYYESVGCEYQGSFNIEDINMDGVLYGLRVKFITDKPFGYGDKVSITLNNYERRTPFNIYNTSDEFRDSPLNIKFKLHKDAFKKASGGKGTLIFKFKKLDGSSEEDPAKDVRIDNCSAGEEIVIDSYNQLITTTDNTHKLYNDFNYNFPSLSRPWVYSSGAQLNTLSVTSSTNGYSGTIDPDGNAVRYFEYITIDYRPIRKGCPF